MGCAAVTLRTPQNEGETVVAVLVLATARQRAIELEQARVGVVHRVSLSSKPTHARWQKKVGHRQPAGGLLACTSFPGRLESLSRDDLSEEDEKGQMIGKLRAPQQAGLRACGLRDFVIRGLDAIVPMGTGVTSAKCGDRHLQTVRHVALPLRLAGDLAMAIAALIGTAVALTEIALLAEFAVRAAITAVAGSPATRSTAELLTVASEVGGTHITFLRAVDLAVATVLTEPTE
jgi:hypothetical protein